MDVSPDGPVGVRSLSDGRRPPGRPRAAQPLVELLVAGQGRARVSHRFSETAVGRRMVYAGSARGTDGQVERAAHRPARREHGPGGAHVVPFGRRGRRLPGHHHGDQPRRGLGAAAGRDVLRRRARRCSRSTTSTCCGRTANGSARAGGREPVAGRDVPDLNLELHGQDGRGRFAVISTGTWSTGTHLPTGGLDRPPRRPGVAVAGRAQRGLALGGGRAHERRLPRAARADRHRPPVAATTVARRVLHDRSRLGGRVRGRAGRRGRRAHRRTAASWSARTATDARCRWSSTTT